MKIVIAIAALFASAPAFAQGAHSTTHGKGIPQEEAMVSCTSQAEAQSLPSDEQKKQFVMACLTGAAGKGPAAKAAPAEQQRQVCEQQRDHLELAGGEGENFVQACVKRNDDLLRQTPG
ncbi:hypothetical protein [Terrihabitans sp. B22-R8]|uniref:hypothetical protein n=1 Tax=Terrihabitans sp. B22-R8 TaxID=3425128 RepID=UPI00403D510B